MRQSSRALPGGSTALRTSCTRRSLLVKMPSFSAKQLAGKRNHNGIRGRLAVVDDPELSNFLRQQFAPRTGAWIGLEYNCTLARLTWVNGRSHPRHGFKNWADPWHNGFACQNRRKPFAPIYVTSVSEGFVWRAENPSKEMREYFVEYPKPQ